MADTSAVKELTEKLENGVKELFASEKYADYLNTMSRFHSYSTRNTLLIHLQDPTARRVAGFHSWRNNFNRSVKKGEHGIKIFAPIANKGKEIEVEKLDPVTKQPILDERGQPVMERLSPTSDLQVRFKLVTVFSERQTEGDPLPELAETLTGDVERYELFMDALRAVSPLPIFMEDLPPDTDGTCHFGEKIAIRNGMSEIQTVCAVIHEITHAKIHDRNMLPENDSKPKDNRTSEIEAESISWVVNQHFGVETGANSFGYVATWSKGKELKELNAALDTIRKTSASLIDAIDENYRTLAKERGIDLSAAVPAKTQDEQSTETPSAAKSENLSANPIYDKYANIVAEKAAAFAVSSATLLNEDEADARRATDQIVNRVVDDMLQSSGEHYQLFNEYMDNQGFRKQLEDYAFIKAYLEPKTAMRNAQIASEPVETKQASQEIPANERNLIANIQGYIRSYGKVMDITNNEIYQTVLRLREESKSANYRDVAEYMLNERTRLEFEHQSDVREKFANVSQAETPDAKYDIAFKVLVDELCANEELTSLAATGADWQKGAGRTAVYGGSHYETLIETYGAELADLLDNKSIENRLRNTVLGEVYRRLDAIAYNRYILNEYADIAKSGRLDIYETPYPEDSVNTGILVHLTEQLPDGGVHDYGYIFGYDPDDNRDHAINNYLSLKSFALLRESVFGKPETTVTLNYKEIEPVGSTVLRRLLFNDGQFNRELKRTRVDILPPMGKYSVYAQHLSGVIGDDTLIHVGTDSGYLLPLSVSRTRFEEHFVEAQIDSIFEKAPQLLDEALSSPEKFARYDWAAITGRFEETEAHNAVYKSIREEKDRERREEISAQRAVADKEAKHNHIEQTKMNAYAIESGGSFKIETMAYTGKNNLLELFALYGIDVPLATKGWFNNKLVSFEITANGGYSYRSRNNKGRRTSYMGEAAHRKLVELRAAIKAIPIAEKLAQKGLLSDETHEQSEKQNNESMKGGEDMQYSELQEKGFEYARRNAHLPLDERLNIIAQTFGVKSASVFVQPCTGKYSGQSDIMLKLEGGGSTGIGMYSNATARKDSTISDCVNNALAKFNPEIVAEAKKRAEFALLKREATDNAVAAERNLKPYKVLNVELCDGGKDGHTGWYYATIAVGDKVIGFVTSDLASDIGRGVLTDSVNRANYFVAGGLQDTDVDFIFNNVGHSSFGTSYTVEINDDALQRARETLERRDNFKEALEGMKAVENKTKTIENKLHDKLTELFPDFMSGKFSYLKLESPGMEPLSLEWIDENRISVMHTYTMNGDLMYDPMMEYEVNTEQKTVSPCSFEQSMPPLFQRIDRHGFGISVDGNGNERKIIDLQRQLDDFSTQWFSNIEQQGYMPSIGNLVQGVDSETRVIFDKDGKMIMPEPETGNIPYDEAAWHDLADIEDDDLREAHRAEINEILNGGKVETTIAPNPTLPDPTISVDDRNAYGYSYEEMLPLTESWALELYDSNNTVYLLYNDNTEAMAFDREDIEKHDGIFGIERGDWERTPIYTKRMAVTANSEGSREADLLYGNEDKFGIYQVKSGEEYRDYRFDSTEELSKRGLTVERTNYELVYTAPLGKEAELGGIFATFNIERPSDFTGHSLSMSDIIVFQREGNINSYYLDKGGYTELPSFLGNETPSEIEKQPTLSLIDTSSPTVADLEADLKAGKSISVAELAKTVNAVNKENPRIIIGGIPPQKPTSKAAPTLMDEINEAKQLVARSKQPAAKQNEREVRHDTAIHG